MAPLLSIRDVHKQFGTVHALSGVDMDVHPGAVHALIGENGAGKSTLMKVLSGVHNADRGSVEFEGKPYRVAGPASARHAGVAMIYQELTLAPHLSVEANMTLGLESTKFGLLRSQRATVLETLATLGHGELDIRQPVSAYSIGIQQVIEIARALMLDAKVVIMDEPTSSLSAADSESLFQVIGTLRDRGIAVIYISHFLEEVQRIADDYTVLRDGQTVGSGKMADVTLPRLINMMVGRTLDEMYPRLPHDIGEPVLEVTELDGEPLPKTLSFTLRRGEILGIAGLIGAGRSETLRAIFGLQLARDGRIQLANKTFSARKLTPRRGLRLGLDLLSEDRKEEGLATRLSIAANMTLSGLAKCGRWGWINLRAEQNAADALIKQLNVRCVDGKQLVDALSGGNQQKVAIARLVHHESDILFLDEPTRGIDVGSKAEINRLIQTFAASGKAVVLVSSYLPELIGICDTLAVMHRGKLSPVRPVDEWTEQSLMQFATSGTLDEPHELAS